MWAVTVMMKKVFFKMTTVIFGVLSSSLSLNGINIVVVFDI